MLSQSLSKLIRGHSCVLFEYSRKVALIGEARFCRDRGDLEACGQ